MNEANELEVAGDEADPTNSDITAARAESAVRKAFRQVLGLHAVDRETPFAALGGDSMRAVRVLSRLWRDLGVDLPVHVLQNDTTAAELAVAVRRYGAGPVA